MHLLYVNIAVLLVKELYICGSEHQWVGGCRVLGLIPNDSEGRQCGVLMFSLHNIEDDSVRSGGAFPMMLRGNTVRSGDSFPMMLRDDTVGSWSSFLRMLRHGCVRFQLLWQR